MRIKKQKTRASSLLLVGLTIRSQRKVWLHAVAILVPTLSQNRLPKEPFCKHPRGGKPVYVHLTRPRHDGVANILSHQKASISVRNMVKHVPSLVVEDHCGITTVYGGASFSDIPHQEAELSGACHDTWIDPQAMGIEHKNWLKLGKGH